MRKRMLLILIMMTVALIATGVILLVQDRPPALPEALATPLPGGEVARISVQELHRLLGGSNPPLVWEFVSAEQFANGHVPGARLMTFEELPAAAQELDNTRAIVTLCT